MNRIRVVCSIILLFIFATCGSAKPRTVSEALSVANLFCINNLNGTKAGLSPSALKLAYICNGNVTTRSTSNTCYYVFNRGNNNGYIIISGDDMARDVLGYTDKGNFLFESIPPNFRYWLASYQAELEYLYSHPQEFQISANDIPKTKGQIESKALTVAPLLQGIEWNQDAPYNNLCPSYFTTETHRSVTGCVATAMAQVMRYYKWPLQGAGSNRYTPPKIGVEQYIDFSQTIFDWANMTEKYNSSSTEIQNNAVATLMYNCGVSVNMNYYDSSSAYTNAMALALVNNFGYDSKLQCISRKYYTKSEWQEIIKTDLNAQRPVFYGGSSSDGGHQFVCDGYDTNNLFHMNWGWGGMANGYFELSALNPTSQGIGGNNGGGFNYGQDIVFGVQKPNFAPLDSYYAIHARSPLSMNTTSVSRDGTFTLNLNNCINHSLFAYNGKWNFAIYDDTGFVSLISTDKSISLDSGYEYPLKAFTSSIPSTIANGTYKIYPVAKGNDQTSWQIIKTPLYICNYINAVVSQSSISFSQPTTGPQFSLNSLTATTNLYSNTIGGFAYSVTNTGLEFNSTLTLKLVSLTDPNVSIVIDSNPYVIATGETKTASLLGAINLQPGQYALSLYYDSANNLSTPGSDVLLGATTIVTVQPTPTETSVLTLTTPLVFSAPSPQVNKNDIDLTATINNSGGYFANSVSAAISKTLGTSFLEDFGYQTLVLDKNATATVHFKGTSSLTPGDYYVTLVYKDAANTWHSFQPSAYSKIPFTLIDGTTAITNENIETITISPNPVSDILYVKSEDRINTITVVDVSGKTILNLNPNVSGEVSIPVSNFNKGMYLLRIETLNGNKVCKFLKE